MRFFLATLLSAQSITAAALTGLTWFGAGPALALEPLETFLASSEDAAFDMQEATLLTEQRSQEATQSWLGLSPVLTASAFYRRNQYEAVARIPRGDGTFREAVITPEDQREVNVAATVSLVDVAKWRRINAGARALDAAQQQRAGTKLDVQRLVTQRYYNVIAAEALVSASERALTASEKNLTVLGERQTAGMTAELDVKRAQAEVERNRQLLADAVYRVAVERRALETLTGRTPEAGAPALSDGLQAEAPLDTWLAVQEGQLPAVRAAQQQSKSADASADATRAQLFPTVEASAAERITNAAGFGPRESYALTVTANWRFDASAIAASRAQHTAAAISRVKAQRALRDAQDRIHNAWYEVVRQLEKSRAAHSQLDAAALAARMARERSGAGTATFLDVVLAERDELSAQASLIEADANLCFARADLRLLANRPHEPKLCGGVP